ncbi:MAG: hypothetical protein A2798_00930 [Candidatus Levybacteria bacterium RIFCSPHIGHO2_01_FULL_37_17]|nr:MAG: hypothetical protein A2798_00930 [Candidatus Levybacteria bacterium RIFCSPHIGHO2_01_FULL_37_17]OGH37015.1 MAG: hypothetical protein A2959_01790 [Candidatus Levybacteria bacterium RIFCSPLOWO2_01_FULL_38_23]
MIDVHCHLNFKAFENDLEEVLERAKKSGVKKIINVGTSLESSKKAVELAQKYEELYAIVGIHPHHADKLSKGWERQIEKLLEQPKVLAIGEIGLDYYSYASNGIVDSNLQKEVFETQIKIAINKNVPLQIHNRQAGKDVVKSLKKYKNSLRNIPGMFHCFASDFQVLKEVLDLGFYIGFDGNITYEGIAKGEVIALFELLKRTPLNKLVVETDAPFLSPIPHRGSRNEPSYVIITAKYIAQLKGVSFSEIDRVTTKNAGNVFNL